MLTILKTAKTVGSTIRFPFHFNEDSVAIDVSSFGISIAAIFLIRRSTEKALIQHDQRTFLAGIRSLLGSFCDANVVLDGELHIVEPAHKLASLLLVLGRDLCSDDFCRHLALCDRDTFRDCVRDGASKVACERANVLHAPL